MITKEHSVYIPKWLLFGTVATLAVIIAIAITIILATKQPSYVGIYYNKSWGEQFGYKYVLVNRQYPNDSTDVAMVNGSYLVLNRDGTCIFVSYLQFPKEAKPHDGRCFYTVDGNTITFNQWYTATILDENNIQFDHDDYVFERVN